MGFGSGPGGAGWGPSGEFLGDGGINPNGDPHEDKPGSLWLNVLVGSGILLGLTALIVGLIIHARTPQPVPTVARDALASVRITGCQWQPAPLDEAAAWRSCAESVDDPQAGFVARVTLGGISL